MSRAAVRLVDVAEQAGVSLATASRVLNSSRPYGVRADLRARVLEAAEQLGYEPNHHARALAGSASMTIGLVVHDVRDAYFALVAGAVVSAAEEHGLFVTIVNTYRDPEQETKYLRLLRAQRPRAIIVAGSGFRGEAAEPILVELKQFEASGGVVVALGTQHAGHSIDVGNYDGSRRLAHSLCDLGHREFAVVTGSAAMNTVADRVEGFRQGLSERGVELGESAVHYGEPTRETGRQAAERFAAARAAGAQVPTCVFGTFDLIAAGLVGGLTQAGIVVPDQVSVAGFGDVPPAADMTPALTTVRLPLEDIGRRAVELALLTEGDRQLVTVEPEVLLRQSTAAPRDR